MLRARWRGRIAAGVAALAVCVVSLGMLASPARADSYTSYLVQQLRHDPVYISSYSPMAQPGDAARIKQLLARIPLKAYVISDVQAGPDGKMQDSDLAAVLHDQLGGGLYIISRYVGDATAVGFGTSLPVDDAMSAASFQLPGQPTLVQLLQRFVAITLSGHTEQQLTAAERLSEQRDKQVDSNGTPAWQVVSATAGGTVLGAAATLTLALWSRRRRRRRRTIPGAGPSGAGLTGTLGIAGLLVLSPAALAHGGGAPAAASPPDGAGAAARALASSPLYVDEDMTWMFTPEQEKQITSALRASPVPVFVAAVPFSTDMDDLDGASYFTDQVYGLSHRDGVYLDIGPSGNIYDVEYRVPRELDLALEDQNLEDAPVSATAPTQIAASVPVRLEKLIGLIGGAPRDPQAAALPQPGYSPGEFTGGRRSDDNAAASYVPPSTAASDLAGGGVTGLVVLGPLLALLGLAGAGAARRAAADRRGWGDDGDPGTPAGRMPSVPAASWLRRHARGELAALERLIDGEGDTNPGWERALDDYDAGMLAAGDDAEPVDLAGAIVLARDGRMALELRLEKPPPPCLVNPLHGRATADLSPHGLDLSPGAGHAFKRAGRIPVCDKCRRATAQRRRERMLRLPHQGTTTRYTDFDSVWRKQLFGATGPGLPQAVREHLHVS